LSHQLTFVPNFNKSQNQHTHYLIPQQYYFPNTELIGEQRKCSLEILWKAV